MTQQPFYPQQYPPQQGYPAQPMQPPMHPQYPAPGYGQPMQGGYPQQGFPAQQQAPAAPPAQAGSIDDYYNQPVAAGGPGISWKNKVEGTSYAGVISGKPTVQQDTDYNTKMPLFQKDGVTPKWVMLIPLAQIRTNHPGPPEFPDGEVVYYARGKDREEITRALAEAGCSGAPEPGATFQVTLVQRKPNRTGNPTNVVQIQYGPPNGQPHQAQAPAAAAPAPQQAPAPQPVQQPQVGTPAPQQWQVPPVPQEQPAPTPMPAPNVQQQAPLPQLTGVPGVPAQQMQGATGIVPQAAPGQIPAPQVAQSAPGQLAPQPPAGMTPEQQATLQNLGLGQPVGQVPA